MPIFPVPSGQFAGMTQDQLLAMRSELQTKLTLAASGGLAQSLSYSQGNGSKSIGYAATSAENIRKQIRMINAALGVSGRRAIVIGFR